MKLINCFVISSAAYLTGALVSIDAAIAHGRLVHPPSRIVLCVQGTNLNCKIEGWKVNAMESGKFFPEAGQGVHDPYAPEDVPNARPPSDGNIAGASINGEEAVLNEQSPGRWAKIPVRGGTMQVFRWLYSAPHKTRRWNYFITKESWNPGEKLTRAQFEEKPFCSYQNSGKPYWAPDAKLDPPQPTVHTCKMPQRDGYHVVLAVWEIADTANAFYQVVDVYFENMDPLVSPF